MTEPRIALMLDEDTEKGGKDYLLPKHYFEAIRHFGGIPYAIPYEEKFVQRAVKEFDGFFSTGGGVALPKEWYVEGQGPLSPPSVRTPIEIKIVESFLQAKKPIMASCFGMQLLAGLHGCKLKSDLGSSHKDKTHDVLVMGKTRLYGLVGTTKMSVNSKHNEGVAEGSKDIVICAMAEDGLIEAVQVPDHPFAFGLQWHQEEFWNQDHPGNKIMEMFVASCNSSELLERH